MGELACRFRQSPCARDAEMGDCHLFWAAKKRILKSQFGLEWQTPAELNPDVCFD